MITEDLPINSIEKKEQQTLEIENDETRTQVVENNNHESSNISPAKYPLDRALTVEDLEPAVPPQPI